MHCAGIIPYDIKTRKLLLGKSKFGEWSSFSGKSKYGENVWATACREFHEETAGMFNKIYVNKHVHKKKFTSRTPSGMHIHIYFISIHCSHDHKNLFNLLRNISSSKDSKEMTEIEWIDFDVVLKKRLRMRHAFFKDCSNIIEFLSQIQQ